MAAGRILPRILSKECLMVGVDVVRWSLSSTRRR
jgi:hypothetical protein